MLTVPFTRGSSRKFLPVISLTTFTTPSISALRQLSVARSGFSRTGFAPAAPFAPVFGGRVAGPPCVTEGFAGVVAGRADPLAPVAPVCGGRGVGPCAGGGFGGLTGAGV